MEGSSITVCFPHPVIIGETPCSPCLSRGPVGILHLTGGELWGREWYAGTSRDTQTAHCDRGL